MIKIACLKCHWSWSLNQDAVRAALDSMESTASHFSVECPRCRRVNKIPRRQLEQAAKVFGVIGATSPASQKPSEGLNAKETAVGKSRSTEKKVSKRATNAAEPIKPTPKKNRP